MKGFRFRLQRVLELREKKEEEQARRLAAAKDDAERARDAQSLLEGVRGAERDRLSGPQALSVGELQHSAFLLECLDGHIAGAAAATSAAADAVRLAERDLVAAFRDRHVLDRLREKHAGAFRAADAAHDRATMDSIALARYAQMGAVTSNKKAR